MIDTIIVRTINGAPMLSAEGMSLLFGVPPDEILAHVTVSNGTVTLPDEWRKAGRRRASESAAHTGSRDIMSGLEYWAAKQGQTLEVVDE